MSDVITVRRASKALGLTPQALYLAIREGRIKSRQELDRVVIPMSEFNRLLEERQSKSSSNGKKKAA